MTSPKKSYQQKLEKPDLLIVEEIPQETFDAKSTKTGEGPAPDTKKRTD